MRIALGLSLAMTGCCMGSVSTSSGLTPTTSCPTDPLAAIGTHCMPEGRLCGTSDPQFTHFIMCSDGVWVEMEAPPPPPPPPPPAP